MQRSVRQCKGARVSVRISLVRYSAVKSLRCWAWPSLLVAFALPAGAEEALPSVDAQIPWTVELRHDDPVAGYVVYKRIPPGSSYAAYRLEGRLGAPPDAVARAAREGMVDPNERQASMSKEIIRNDDGVVVVYSYIDMPPFVTDRDIVTRAEHIFDPETQTHRLEWHSTDEGPSPRDGVIRVEVSDGSWLFEPLEGGHTRVTYESHTEIAGSIPAWLVNSLMNDTVVESFNGLKARVESQANSGG